MNFAVDDRYFYATIEDMKKGRIMQSLLSSNDPSYVKHFMSVFEEMWENAVDAKKVEPHTLDNEEDMKAYLNEVLKEIRRIRGTQSALDRLEILGKYHCSCLEIIMLILFCQCL